jgi:alpha-D-glucose phosphate-specific phosphoglucomutase
MYSVGLEIKFGTDGWRGVISEDFTFENVQRVSQAIASYYSRRAQTTKRKLIIAVGYDSRFMSDRYAGLVSEVLARNGIDVILSDRVIPTPTLSFTVKNRRCTAGVVITASHNPAEYNGIKIKTASGGAASLEITKEVEKLIEGAGSFAYDPSSRAMRGTSRAQVGKIKKLDLTKDYLRFLRSYIDFKKLKSARFKVLVDAMHGSGNSFIAEVLKDTKIKLEFLRADINPSFEGLRPEPVLENLKITVERMKKEKFDLSLVLDGDADRIAAFTGKTEFINPQKILGLLTLHLVQDRKETGSVVKTIVGSNLIDNITRKLGLNLYQTPVGFKYISELMLKEDILIGGEEAGGIGFKNYIPERDGTLAGLLLLEMMVYHKKSMQEILRDMEKEFGRYYYLRDELNLGPTGNRRLESFKNVKEILGKAVTRIDDLDGLKFICSDESWLMLRISGTEPIMRIYAESRSLNKSKKLIKFGKNLILNGKGTFSVGTKY